MVALMTPLPEVAGGCNLCLPKNYSGLNERQQQKCPFRKPPTPENEHAFLSK